VEKTALEDYLFEHIKNDIKITLSIILTIFVKFTHKIKAIQKKLVT